MKRPASRLVVGIVIVVAACGGETTVSSPGTTSPVTAVPGVDPGSVPEVTEISLTGLVETELAMRESIRDGLEGTVEATNAGFWERFDSDLAEHGRSRLAELADSAGLGPLAASGLTVSLSEMNVRPLADWGGSMQAVSGNFTVSMFMALILRDWQQLSNRDWSVSGELPPDVHDRVVDGLAEHSEITTAANGSASADQLHFEVEVNATATLTEVTSGEEGATFESNGRGMIEVKGCPDPEGVAEGRFTLSLQEQVSGSGASAGGSTEIDGPFRIVNGDDARLVKTDFDGRFDSAANGTTPSGEHFDWNVESTYPISIPAGGGLDFDIANATYEETNPSGARGERATGSAIGLAAHLLSGVAKEAEEFWRSGKCVDLVTSEESRKVQVSEELTVDVEARQHFDTAAIDRPVTVTFSGLDRIDPAGTPVDPPASFVYTAGTRQGDKGTIQLEQKSKRGIGKKTLEFEVEAGAVVLAIGANIEFIRGGVTQSVVDINLDATRIEATEGSFQGSAIVDVAGTWFLRSGIASCDATLEASTQATVTILPDISDEDRFVVSLRISDHGLPADATCQIASGQTITVPVDMHYSLTTFEDLFKDGVEVTAGQSVVVDRPDASGQFSRHAEITLTQPDS